MTTAALTAAPRRFARLRRLVPQPLIDRVIRWRFSWRLINSYLYDARRYASASALGASPTNETQYAALVTMAYHQIEKGMSLPEPRPFYGQDALRKLFALLERFAQQYRNNEATGAALGALHAYVQWHTQRGMSSALLESVNTRLAGLQSRLGVGAIDGHGAVLQVDRPPAAVQAEVREHLLAGRRSIRDFGPGDVPLASIEEAVRLALNAPSVCNRQGWRVRCLHDPQTIARALKHQNGNRGFGQTVNRLLVVTSTLGSFAYPGERNEAWIDGGLFSMSLMLALHALGLASCPLNWNHEAASDRAFRREFDVPDAEVVIMFIAVGFYKSSYAICGSPRLPVSRVLQFVGPVAGVEK